MVLGASEIALPLRRREVAIGDGASPLLPRSDAHIPQNDNILMSAGDQSGAIRTESDAVNLIGVTRERLPQTLPFGNIPQDNHFVVTAGRKRFTIGAERHRVHILIMAEEW